LKNGASWDPDSSTNCTIFGCTFYTGDDFIAIKSGKNPEGNVINRPTRHIRIFDCDVMDLAGFDERGHELKNITFRDITIGQQGSTRRQVIALQLCENITIERLRCL